MTYPGKCQIKDSLSQFLPHSWQLFCHGDKKRTVIDIMLQCAPLHGRGTHCTTPFTELSSHGNSMHPFHLLYCVNTLPGFASDAEGVSIDMGDEPTAPPAAPEPVSLLTQLMPYLSKFGVFVLIILLKVLYTHRYGTLQMIESLRSCVPPLQNRNYSDSTY